MSQLSHCRWYCGISLPTQNHRGARLRFVTAVAEFLEHLGYPKFHDDPSPHLWILLPSIRCCSISQVPSSQWCGRTYKLLNIQRRSSFFFGGGYLNSCHYIPSLRRESFPPQLPVGRCVKHVILAWFATKLSSKPERERDFKSVG